MTTDSTFLITILGLSLTLFSFFKYYGFHCLSVDWNFLWVDHLGLMGVTGESVRKCTVQGGDI